jgi:hypothetical protein
MGAKEKMMLTRIATWSLGAVLGLGLVASAQAAPTSPKSKPSVQTPKQDGWRTDFPARPVSPQRRNPVFVPAANPAPMTEAVFDTGRIERIEDNLLIYSVELPAEARAALAAKKGVPVSQVPDRIEKTALIDYSKLTPSVINNRIGQEVQVELRQDTAGYMYATNLLTVKRN